VRAQVRRQIGRFAEVYVDTPLEECTRRDVQRTIPAGTGGCDSQLHGDQGSLRATPPCGSCHLCEFIFPGESSRQTSLRGHLHGLVHGGLLATSF
jgi:hypothetical protein